MVPAFATHLRALIAAAYPSLRAFVRAAEPERNEDAAVAYLSKVLQGQKPPPLERIEAWADALRLRGTGRQRFIEDAHLLHATPLVRGLVERLRRSGDARRAASPERPYESG